MDPWQLLKEVKAIGPNALTATALAPEGSKWFEGHFPGEPILPGIAIVQTVYSAIAQDAAARGESVALNSLKRVKFMSPVRPGERLDVSLNREMMGNDAVYVFKVNVSGNVVCTGMVTVVPSAIKIKAKRRVGMPETKETQGIIRHVAGIIIEELKLEDVTAETFDPDMDLVDELGIDSMDLATIALVLQDEYKIVIDEDDYPKLKTVRLICEYIEEKQASRH